MSRLSSLFLLITMILLFMLTVEQLIVESNSSKGKNLSSKRNKMHSIIKNGNVSSEQKESNNILNNEDIEVIELNPEVNEPVKPEVPKVPEKPVTKPSVPSTTASIKGIDLVKGSTANNTLVIKKIGRASCRERV